MIATAFKRKWAGLPLKGAAVLVLGGLFVWVHFLDAWPLSSPARPPKRLVPRKDVKVWPEDNNAQQLDGAKEKVEHGQEDKVINLEDRDAGAADAGKGKQIGKESLSQKKDLNESGNSVKDAGEEDKPAAGYATLEDIPKVKVTSVSCANLFTHDPAELTKAKEYQEKNPKKRTPDESYEVTAKDCQKFIKDRQYVMKPLNKEEEEFPIAYSIMLFKDVELVERLLRAIYRPQNYYCLHVDKKSSPEVQNAIKAIVSCFDNVFLASRQIDVQWAWFSVLEPDLVCMEDLWRFKRWKYFINLTGQEFPLKTNWDLVKILKVFNGANSMEGTVRRRNKARTEFVHNGFFPTNTRKGPHPHNITLTKGSVHITVSRAYVDFLLHNKIALEFREWVKNTGVPDETFFSSLNHSPHLSVPGAYKGEPETDQIQYPFITRFKNWGDGPFNWPCEGQRVRMVCIFSVGDLMLLKSRPELFANKFYIDYNPLAYDCMEELHFNRTRNELAGIEQFDTKYYEQLSFVKNHV